MTDFSHLDGDGNIQMVDVGEKTATQRSATAKATVIFPPKVYHALRQVNGQTKKGSITDTAHIAGIMAAKKTSDLIPLCHPLPLDSIKLEFTYQDEKYALSVSATARVTHKTGVEMEALTAVSVAALTIYDMTKAMSHQIKIDDIHLVKKTGGKSDFVTQPEKGE